MNLYDPLFTAEAMRDLFSSRRTVQGMLDFEAALAKALVRCGIAPASSLAAIESQCRAELLDLESLAREAALAGNLAIPLVKALTARVAALDAGAAGFVHWGATSQDAIDTGSMLQLRDAFGIIEDELQRLSTVLANLATEHASTLMAGRTWLQQAPPVTFGLVVAGWLSAVERDRARLRESRRRILVLQFGGAVGTLAAFGDRGLEVAAALAEELKLDLPDLPWHSNRDRIAEAATVLGLLTGSLGKIARDVSLLAQTEIGEASEPAEPGRGGSSTMPHKRNPVGSAVVLAAALRVPALVSVVLTAMVQEQQRGLGGWHAEWQVVPEIFMLTAGALSQTIRLLDGLAVHADKMAANLEATHGLILSEAVAMALGRHVGKLRAHGIVERACHRSIEQEQHLRQVLIEDAEVREYLSVEQVDALLDPRNYTGAAPALIKRVLAACPPQS